MNFLLLFSISPKAHDQTDSYCNYNYWYTVCRTQHLLPSKYTFFHLLELTSNFFPFFQPLLLPPFLYNVVLLTFTHYLPIYRAIHMPFLSWTKKRPFDSYKWSNYKVFLQSALLITATLPSSPLSTNCLRFQHHFFDYPVKSSIYINN